MIRDYPCEQYVGTPQQRTNTESIAAKLTRVPTATDKRRVRCYTRSRSDEETQDKISTEGEGDS
jgi:hypothetical protein